MDKSRFCTLVVARLSSSYLRPSCVPALFSSSIGIVQKVFSEKASAMRQKCVKMGLVLLGKSIEFFRGRPRGGDNFTSLFQAFQTLYSKRQKHPLSPYELQPRRGHPAKHCFIGKRGTFQNASKFRQKCVKNQECAYYVHCKDKWFYKGRL